MAEVFRSKTYGVEGFERFVAVKKILPNIAEDEEFISMFIDEAKIAVQLNHANIAQIFDLGKVDGSYFIALEYIHGKDLRAIFDRCQGMGEIMPLPQACFIIMKVCEGLDYAHNKRDSTGREMHLVHRDVSPQNVLISYEGEVKLVDFGIAKAVGKASKTQAGILKGKFGYMSPEQVRGMPLDRRSDIFSVGIVLYELITGERLFQGESDFSTLEKVRNAEILPPSTYNRKIPEELEQIVLRALAKDVDDRYEYAIDLHDDLQAFMYSSGAFYSRKDLASWMKERFTKEIGEEDRKLEEYRHLSAPELVAAGPPKPPPLPTRSPDAPSGPPPPPLPGGGNGHRSPSTTGPITRPPPLPGSMGGAASSTLSGMGDVGLQHEEFDPRPEPVPALTWDDDEVETQIYDKPTPEDMLAMATGMPLPKPAKAEKTGPGVPLPAEEKRPFEVVAPASKPAADGELARRLTSREPVDARGGKSRRDLDSADSLSSLVAARGSADPLGLKSPATGLGLAGPADPLSTLRVPPLAAMPLGGQLAGEKRGSKLGLWLGLVALVLALCGGALYYFLVLADQPGSITVVASPSDVTVYLDNKEQPSAGTPLTIPELRPSYYVVTVHKPGYERWTKPVQVRAGEDTKLTPRLEPISNSAIKLYCNVAKAEAFLDGRKLGVPPMLINKVSAGKRRLEVRKPGYRPWIQEFEIQANETQQFNASLVKLELELEINSTPDGDVFLLTDGEREKKGRTPLTIKLNPLSTSTYSIAVVREGYVESVKSVEWQGKESFKLAFALDKEGKGAAAPAATGTGAADEAAVAAAAREAARKEAAERKEAEKAEAARKRAEAAEAKKAEAERKKAAQAAARAEAAERKKAEKEAAEARQAAARERAAQDKAGSAARAKAAREKAAREKAAASSSEGDAAAAREKAEQEKAAREKAEQEKAAREKAEREKAAADNTPKGGTGWLLLGSTPWTQIFINGKDMKATTPQKIPLPAGKYRVTLQNPKFQIDKSFPAVVKTGETTKIIQRFSVTP